MENGGWREVGGKDADCGKGIVGYATLMITKKWAMSKWKDSL